MTTVSSGQTLFISAGQTSNGVVVLSGGILTVLSGGMANGTILSGGDEKVFEGGVASGTVVSSGGKSSFFPAASPAVRWSAAAALRTLN